MKYKRESENRVGANCLRITGIEQHPQGATRTKAKALLDFSLAIVLAIAVLGPPAYLVRHFYQTLDEPDARDELPEVTELAAMVAAVGRPQGQVTVIAKGSNVHVQQSFAFSDSKQFLQAARAAALANHYREPSAKGAATDAESMLMLCSERSAYRFLEADPGKRQVFITIWVRSRPVEECAKK
jgi:hypothetical protein